MCGERNGFSFERKPQFEQVKLSARYERPRVVTIYAEKGGDGKTTTAVELACCLGSAGYRVLVIDFDTSNASSFFFVKGLNAPDSPAKEKNTARALFDEGNDLKEFALPSIRRGVDVIPCSYNMAMLRTMNEKRLVRMLPALNGVYDVVIIDCKPNYDNFALNAFNAADYIITPVQKSLDSLNAAEFVRKQLAAETEKSGCWFVTINGYDARHKCAKSGEQKEYIETFRDMGYRLTPQECWFPWTRAVRQIKDRRGFLSRTERADIKGCVCAPALYSAVVSLASTIIDEDDITPAEVF